MSPRTTSSAPPTLVRIDPDARIPLYRQIYDSLRDAIVSGRLAPRAPVPPTRVLAQELQVSRNTTAAAVAQLRAEGYLEVRPRSGTFVSPRLPEVAVVGSRRRARLASRADPLAALSRRGARVAALQPSPTSPARPFRYGVPALDAFPWTLRARLTSRWLR
ncbi:MAG TPA: GntR family transcriptional regulator, partial [Gemmatimonadales bacterium]|nr:GntR family transcriptional regulator [Gemmatimonadales bacterium]